MKIDTLEKISITVIIIFMLLAMIGLGFILYQGYIYIGLWKVLGIVAFLLFGFAVGGSIGYLDGKRLS